MHKLIYTTLIFVVTLADVVTRLFINIFFGVLHNDL